MATTVKDVLSAVQAKLEKDQSEKETQQKERAIKYIKLAKRSLGREKVELDPSKFTRPEFTNLETN